MLITLTKSTLLVQLVLLYLSTDYHGTVRVDRLEGYKNWRTKLAASSTPALTQIMFPPFRPPQVIQPVLRSVEKAKSFAVKKII